MHVRAGILNAAFLCISNDRQRAIACESKMLAPSSVFEHRFILLVSGK